MSRTAAVVVVALLAPLAAHAAHAAPVAITPVQCTNLSEGECAAVGAVFQTSYASVSGAPVMLAASAGPPGTPYAPPAGAPAADAGADHLNVSAMRLTSLIALRASLTRADGVPIHAVQMTVTSLDDLPPAADRMARALVTRTAVY